MATLEPDRILQELNRIWAELGRAEGEAEGVVRACSITLIAFAEETDDPAPIAETLATLMREHPNRAILVRVRHGSAPFLGHQVLSQCWKPLGRGEQICCERIEITASEASLPEIAPVLVALRAPDLPLVLWYRSARVLDMPRLGARDLNADRFIVDSDASDPARMFQRLTGSGAPGADLAWTRLTRWRAIIAQTFEGPGARDLLPRLQRIRVLYSGDHVPARALYLAAWMLDALGREVEYGFDAVEGESGALQGLEFLADAGRRVSIRRMGDAVLIETDGVRSCAGLPPLKESELLGEELSMPSRDPVFEKALTRAARLGGERR